MKLAETLVAIYRKIPVGASSLIILLIICYLTLDPEPFGDEDLPLFPGADKVAHFLMFGGLAGALSLDLWRFGWKRFRQNNPVYSPSSSFIYPPMPWTKCLLGFLVSSVTGGIIEILQQQMQLGRSAELADLIADSLGAIVGGLVAYLLARSVRRL